MMLFKYYDDRGLRASAYNGYVIRLISDVAQDRSLGTCVVIYKPIMSTFMRGKDAETEIQLLAAAKAKIKELEGEAIADEWTYVTEDK